MNHIKTYLALVCVLFLGVARAAEEEASPLTKLNWVKGPAKASMREIAQVQVPAGYMFVDGAGAKKILEAMGNITNGREMGFLSPTNMDWFVVFEFDPVGYVKDDDKDKLNADKMLEAIREGTEYQNKEREKMGVAPLHILGWEQPPHYNAETHNLEWAIKAESEGKSVLNHNTRLLGRKGVMEVTLVANPDEMSSAMPTFNSLLAGYSFQSGQTYAEYKQGDKVAKYGLAALVVGGAAVGAAKLGIFAWLALFFKKAGKIIIIAVVAVAAFFRKIIGRLFGRKDDSTMS